VWNGDSAATMEGMSDSLKQLLRLGPIMYSMVGSDTGGYGRNPSAETFARWLALSAYSPMMELLIGPSRTPWYSYTAGANTTPPLVDVARTFTQDHHDLIPYIRSLVYYSTVSGMPAMRMMPLVFPDDPKVADILLAAYPKIEPELQPKAIDVLTQRAVWSKTLLGEIGAKKIPQSALNVNQVRKLLASKDAALVKQVTAVWGTIRTDRNPQREQLVAQMRDMLKQTPGDPKAGRLHYNKICAQCHKMYGEGQDIGPDITANGRSDFEQLLSNVFDPSLVIGAGYTATTVVNNSGQVFSGLLVEDSPQRIVLKTQGGKIETIARGDVDQVARGKLSYMPEDVEKQLRPQEIADLFAYLCLDRPPEDPKARKIPGTPR